MTKVYVPTWNSIATLEKCLKSIEKAVPNAEITIIDRASTDGTRQIAEKYGEYVVFEGNLGEARTLICKLAAKQSDMFLMVDSDVELPPNFLSIAKEFMTEKVGAVFGVKVAEAEKARSYEIYAHALESTVYPVVNGKRMDTACTLFRPEATNGFHCNCFSFEDYALGKYINSKGFKHVRICVVCSHLGFDDFRVYLAHQRWSGAGVRYIRFKAIWQSLVSLIVMPLRSPCKLTTFQVRLHYTIGFLLSRWLLEYERKPRIHPNWRQQIGRINFKVTVKA